MCLCNQEAEEMHIKAIKIKEQLLGHEDYEVALSVGHLASLYNYDMNQYEDAERLYLRSIAIGQSGLSLSHCVKVHSHRTRIVQQICVNRPSFVVRQLHCSSPVKKCVPELDCIEKYGCSGQIGFIFYPVIKSLKTSNTQS